MLLGFQAATSRRHGHLKMALVRVFGTRNDSWQSFSKPKGKGQLQRNQRRPSASNRNGNRDGNRDGNSNGDGTGTGNGVTRDGQQVPQLHGEPLHGMHSVLQALTCDHRQLHALFLRDTSSSSSKPKGGKDAARERQALAQIEALAKAKQLPIRFLTKWMLNHITDDKPHQGVVLDAAPLSLPEFQLDVLQHAQERKRDRSPLVLALDEIHDPQNYGAILRSAQFLGCDAVIASEKNTAPLSPTVSRASVGALEVLVATNKLFKARNLHQTLAMARDNDWHILGAALGANTTPCNQYIPKTKAPTILVMGNEHRGLRKNIRLCCDEFVIIPGRDNLHTSGTDRVSSSSLVDSLNVSVATGILLYQLLHVNP